MITAQNRILTQTQVSQILKRIAFEIYENNFEDKHLVLVGIYDKGYHLAEVLFRELNQIVDKNSVSLVRLDINKENPLASEVQLDVELDKLKGKVIIMVDDVLNTGRTMAHSLQALLETRLKRVEIAVLVNRSHKAFPLSAKYKGYELSTSIDEHVEVRLGKDAGVYLY